MKNIDTMNSKNIFFSLSILLLFSVFIFVLEPPHALAVDIDPPSFPTEVRWTTPASDTTPTFTWRASADNVGVSGYDINYDYGAWRSIGNVTSYTEVSPITGMHTFYVRARDAAGNTSPLNGIVFSITPTTAPPPPPSSPTPAPITTPSTTTPSTTTPGASLPSPSSSSPSLQFPSPPPPAINIPGKKLFNFRLNKNQKKKAENFSKNNATVKRSQGLTLNRNILRENLFNLNIFDDVTLTAEVSKRQTKSGKTTVSGTVSGLPESSFTLVQKGAAVAGNIRTKEGVYEIRSLGGGAHIVQFIDTELLPEDTHPNQPQTPSASAPLEEPASVAPFEADLFVGYTREVTSSFGGDRDSVVAAIELAVEEANEIYENSNILFRLRLIKTAQVTYRDSGDLQDDLDYISDTSLSNHRRRNDVERPRNNSRADLYTLLVKDGGGFCGIAWQMDQSNYQTFSEMAFNVVDADCLSNLTLAHEIGHNMGAGHDRDNANIWPLNPTYAYGYRSAEDGFRTVMAYACPREEGVKSYGCPRIKYFSSATQTYNGKPLGSDNENNARTLGSTARRVSEFRRCVSPVPSPCIP